MKKIVALIILLIMSSCKSGLITQELNKSEIKNYDVIKQEMWFVRTDLIKLLIQNFDYYKLIISQTHSNNLMFKQKSTLNQMDYYNNGSKYLSNQIIIMRKDIKNY
jgi:hypothetical protein